MESLKKAWGRVPAPVRLKVRRQLPKALVAKYAAKRPSGAKQGDPVKSGRGVSEIPPLLSVIVPVYNVEQYLSPCLESIVNQAYQNLEIIVVDDGSTDDSLLIAQKFGAVDDRISIISQMNAGLGAARNTGIRVATGQFVTFADSDDIVPKDAYKSMMGSLRKTGSDFVVGSLNRLIGSKREIPKWAKEIHSSDRLAIQLEDYPSVLQDVFAWNKIFRKDFWDRHVVEFPEGVLYEDQEPTARAYLKAESFDVIRDVVYDWRIREDRTSITQRKDSVKDLGDRLNVCIKTRHVLEQEASPSVMTTWLAKVLGPDLGQYYIQVPRTDNDYWLTLREGITNIVDDLTPEVLDQLDINYRVMVYLILANNREDVSRVAVHQSQYGTKFPLKLRDGQLVAEPEYLISLQTQVPQRILEVSERALKVKSKITSIIECGPRKVTIRGYAYIDGLATSPATSISISLVGVSTGISVELPTAARDHIDVDNFASDPWQSYEHAGFETDLDFDAAVELGLDTETETEWIAVVTVSDDIATVEGNFESRDMSGTAATLPLLRTSDGTRHIFRFSQEHGLSVLPMRYKRFVSESSVDGREIHLKLELPAGETPVSLRLDCTTAGLRRDVQPFDVDNPAIFRFTLPAIPDAVPTTAVRWKVRVGTHDGKFHHLAWPNPGSDLRRQSDENVSCVVLRTTGYGYIELYDRAWQVVAQRVEVSPEGSILTVEGESEYSDSSDSRVYLPRMVLASDHGALQPISLSSLGGKKFRVSFALNMSPEDPDTTAASGLYTLRSLGSGNRPSENMYWVPVSSDLEQTLPWETVNSNARVRLSRTPRAGALAVTLSPPFETKERGKLRQTKLQAAIPDLLSRKIVPNAVLFESFGGSGVSDSGLGIFNELMKRDASSPKYWSVRDASIPVPQGAERVFRYSERWYELLHTAEYVVNNNNFPFFYQKHPDQKYVQTWHGTPLKKIANDIPSSSLSLAYIDLMKREVGYWDYLLAQNDFAADTLPSAFDYSGSVLNLGYPRNDALVAEESQQKREEARRLLGLPAGQQAVLYAPTWRDNVRTFNNRYMMADFLDYAAAGDLLGPDYVFLLRGHSNVSSGRTKPNHRNVIDVTDYPNINDLYLAADILVTDYSSVMFDFCVTGKPIYFLTPDLDEYRDKVRGFYFDFESAAPGPLCADTSALCGAIAADVSGKDYESKYDEFRQRFAPRDDGNASVRVVDAIWGESQECR